MFAHLLSRQEKSLAVPDFPGGQRPFPPLLSWDFMDQLVSSVHSGMGVGQGTGSPAAFHASMQNQPQTTAPAWTDRWMHLERALVILGSRKPQAGVDTPLGAPVQVSRCFRMAKSKRHREDSCSAGTGACSVPGMLCGKQGAKAFPGTFSSWCCSWQSPYNWFYEEGRLLRV